MHHTTIQDHELIRRYVQGSLDVAMRERFEDHYVGCVACQDAVAWEGELHAAMFATAAEETARTETALRAGLFAFLVRQTALRRGLVLTATLALALVPLLGWQRERAAHQATLERVNRAPRPASVTAPVINTPMFYLTAARGSESAASRIPVPAAGVPMVLVMELDSTGFTDHRAVLERGDEILWRQAGLTANAFGAFVVTLPPGYLAPGRYRLRLEGLRADAQPLEVGRYIFEIAD